MSKDVDEKRKKPIPVSGGRPPIPRGPPRTGGRPKPRTRGKQVKPPRISNPNIPKELQALIAEVRHGGASTSDGQDGESHTRDYFYNMGAKEGLIGLTPDYSVFIYPQRRGELVEFKYQVLRTMLENPFCTRLSIEEKELVLPYDLAYIVNMGGNVTKCLLEDDLFSIPTSEEIPQSFASALTGLRERLVMIDSSSDIPQAIITHIGAIYIVPEGKIKVPEGFTYREPVPLGPEDILKIQSDLKEYDERVEAKLTSLGAKRGLMGLTKPDCVFVYQEADGIRHELIKAESVTPHTLAYKFLEHNVIYRLVFLYDFDREGKGIQISAGVIDKDIGSKVKIVTSASKPFILEEKLEKAPDLIVTHLGGIYAPIKSKLELETIRELAHGVREQNFYEQSEESES